MSDHSLPLHIQEALTVIEGYFNYTHSTTSNLKVLRNELLRIKSQYEYYNMQDNELRADEIKYEPKPKYQIGDRFDLQLDNVVIPKTINGIMKDNKSESWMYGFYLGINYMWQPIWFSQEYLDLYCEKL